MGAARLKIHVVANAKKTGLAGLHGDAVKIRCAAPPLDGRANREVREILAGLLGVPVRDVTIARGERSRDKIVEVAGMDADEARARLGV
ncbi:MAG: DUF167 domain-containing protein [Gemmatimonadaceae bacterium]